MTAMNKVVEGLDDSRESVALSGVYEALAWRHAMGTSIDPNYKRSGQRVIVYPKFLDKLGTVLATGNVGFDTGGNRDLAYEKILEERASWQKQVCLILLPEDSMNLTSWPALVQHSREWMEDAKRIAVAGYRQVLEDGPDKCDSESDAEYSDHGETWQYSEMLGLDGKPKGGRPQCLTTAHANALRAAAKAKAKEKLMAVPTSRTRTPTDRKPPALLASLVLALVAIGWVACETAGLVAAFLPTPFFACVGAFPFARVGAESIGPAFGVLSIGGDVTFGGTAVD
jgi:hypothetical protein